MTRLSALAMLTLLLTASLGCSVCCTPFDDAYPSYGGKWQRGNRFHGRVGSAFYPAEVGAGEWTEVTPEEIEGLLEPTPAAPMDDTMMMDE